MLKLISGLVLVALLSLSPAFAKKTAPVAPPVAAETCAPIEAVISGVKLAKIVDDLKGDTLDKFNSNYADIVGHPSPAVGTLDRLTVFGRDDADFVVFVGSMKGCIVGHQRVPLDVYKKIKFGPDTI